MEKKTGKSNVNFIPNSAAILVEWYEKEEKESSIVVPDHLKQEYNSGLNGINQVVAIGPQVVFCDVGDWVMLNISGDAVNLMNIDGKMYAYLRESQIAGKFPKGQPTLDTTKGIDMPPHFTTNRRTDKKLKEFADKVDNK